MLLRPEVISTKADQLIKRCQTRDALVIAGEIGIYLHSMDNLESLLGMYTCRYRERHILLNAKMDKPLMQMVCAHEIGHDRLHRRLAAGNRALQEFTLFDMRSETEYEANAFAAHLCIDDDELTELLRTGVDIVQASAVLGVNVNLTLIKLHEWIRMGRQLDLPYLPQADFLRKIAAENREFYTE